MFIPFNFYEYYYATPNDYRQMPLPNVSAHARILHASPNTPGVDVYANGSLLARNLTYKSFTPYLKLPPGNYDVKVFLTGNVTNPIAEKRLEIAPKSIATIAAINLRENLDLLPIVETDGIIKNNLSLVRFVHLSPNSPRVNVTLGNGEVLFKNIGYKEITGYLPIQSINHTFQLRDPNSGNIILNVPNAHLRPNRFYTLYAVGLSNGTPPLQMLIPLDGISYL